MNHDRRIFGKAGKVVKLAFLGVMIAAAGMTYAGIPQRLFGGSQETADQGSTAGTDSEPQAGENAAAGTDSELWAYQDAAEGTDLEPQASQDAAEGTDLEPQADQDAAAGTDSEPQADQGTAADADFIQEDHGGVDLDADVQEENDGEKKLVALTFDDGPHSVYTAKLLDGLAERDVKATFFLIGKNIPGNEDLVARMADEGHLIGNHTYDHVKISDLSEEAACEQVEKTCELVREITGKTTEFVRPPFGEWKQGLECSFTMIPVLWDVDPLDWTTTSTSLVVQRVLDDVEDGGIILLHDCYDSSVEAAFQIIDALLEKNYEFVTVDKLILE